MIQGVGIDGIEVARVEKELSLDDGFKEATFTAGEIAYCDAKADKAMFYAARFAAKEAFMKALGTGWGQGVAFGEVEITHDDLGKPDIRLHGRSAELAAAKGVVRVHVSFTHLGTVAAAVVILEH